MMHWWKKLCTALLLLMAMGQVSAAALTDIKVINDEREATVTLSFDGRPLYAFFPLTNPNRVVIDIQQSSRSVTGLPLNFSGRNLVKKIRSSEAKQANSIRLVFEVNGSVKTRAVTQEQGSSYTVVFTLTGEGAVRQTTANSTSRTESHTFSNNSEGSNNNSGSASNERNPFHADSVPVVNSTSTASRRQPAVRSSGNSNRIVVAIDAGHGGQDPGAIGPTGLKEKTVTLAVSRKLKFLLERDPMFKPVLTRDGDYFISVMGRSDVARNKGANLLVSIHADAAPSRSAAGASVWVLSNRRADSELGSWLEQHEKQSELLGGAGDVLANSADDRYLSQAVLDLQFGHSQRVGYDVAVHVLRQFGKISSLHKRSPEHASLGVLRSPDIPSLLVETGFISNNTEERLLGSNAHQDKIANAIYQGIREYFLANPLQSDPKPVSRSQGAPGAVKSSAQKQESFSQSSSKKETARKEVTPSQNDRAQKSNIKNVQTHVVKRAETLSGIAVHYGTTAQVLTDLNKLKKPGVWVGQRLKVPAKAETAKKATAKESVKEPKKAAKSAVKKHTVKRGDSLSTIAAKYGVSTAELKRVNKLKSDNAMLGQVLTIPQ